VGSPAVVTSLSTTQYGVTGIGSPTGGAVTYPLAGAPLASGVAINLRRVVPYVQSTSIVNQGGFYPDVIEAALDYATMEAQQLAEGLSRAVQVPIGSGLDPNSYLPTIQAAQVAAAASAGAAAGSAAAASTQATNAATSAAAAAGSAGTASTQATNAATCATAAAGSAGTASTQATNAATSATASAGSASTASTQAANAATSAGSAASSASGAAGSAVTATAAATNAASSAAAAATSASSAAASATTATTQATAATAAATSATAALAAFNTATIASLRTIVTSGLADRTVANVRGYYSDDDGGGGAFIWTAASTATDDGGVTINPTGNAGAGRWLRWVLWEVSDSRLLEALQGRDWPTVARLYNGPRYAENHYDTRLADAYAAASEEV